ncbi:MAG: hypothetical protein H0V40_11335, partial [Actinobacteria bacterium]|nr:hypothetical protein [Actinomycetota bacterium]
MLRGGPAARLVSLAVGLLLFAVGIVGFLQARLGLPPWDVLHQGIDEATPLSFGLANVAVGLVVLVAAALLGARVALGTFANALLVGLFIDGLLSLDAVDRLGEAPLAARVTTLAIAIGCIGVGTALYIGAN